MLSAPFNAAPAFSGFPVSSFPMASARFSAFAQSAPLFFQVGDCLRAETVAEANRLGFNAAMDIGTRW